MNNSIIPTKKETRLETAVESESSIAVILDSKLTHYRDLNMPVESCMADYIALGQGSQIDKIAQLKQYKKDIDETIKSLEELSNETQSEVFKWMKNNGLEKLKGIHCSSITIKEAGVSIRTKIVRDITDKELLEKGYAHEEETIADTKESIKINKRRAK